MQAADKTRLAVLQHFDNLAFGTSAPVHAGDAGHHAVAVQNLLHFTGTEEQILTTVVTDQETKTVLVAQHAAFNEIEFVGNTKITASIAHDLTIALHCRDAPAECLTFAFADVELSREIGFFQRYAGFDHDLKDQLATGYGMFV